jgi:hypothetical protein
MHTYDPGAGAAGRGSYVCGVGRVAAGGAVSRRGMLWIGVQVVLHVGHGNCRLFAYPSTTASPLLQRHILSLYTLCNFSAFKSKA